jgi:glycosyltransferase involved in cell wall biosynthesis
MLPITRGQRDVEKMRIVHIVEYLMPNMGYQEFLLPKWNARHGHEVHIITSDRYTPFQNYDQIWKDFLGPRICGTGRKVIEGVTVHRLRCVWEWRMRTLLIGLNRKLSELKPEIAFCHGTESLNAVRLARYSKREKVPLLIDNHMVGVAMNTGFVHDLFYRSLQALAPRLLVASVYRFLGVAEECCDFMTQYEKIPSHKVQCLPLGIDTEMFRFDEIGRVTLRKQYGIPADAKVVLQTGKLTADKAPHLLAQAMSKVMRNRSEVWLVYVGAGPIEMISKIREPLDERGMIDRLRIVPFVNVSVLSKVYSMADICCYPAGTSLSCLEAAACSRAVVMTDLPASRQRAEAGVGLCYRTGDVGHLEHVIAELVSGEERRRSLGEKAMRAIGENFSYDKIAYRSEEIMKEAISSAKGIS